MGKGGVVVVAVMMLAAVVGTAAVLSARRVSRWIWARAEARARWEPHTVEGAEISPDGIPIAEVTVQLVARSFGRIRVLRTRLVGKVVVRYFGDPVLLELEALAENRAEIRNTSLRGRYR
jgi:hypothetical protein